MSYAEHPLSFWESRFWHALRHRMPSHQPPNKPAGHWVSNQLPHRQHFTSVVRVCCWRNLLWLHLVRTLGSLRLDSSRLCPVCFPFADFAVYPFAVIIAVSCASSQWITGPRGGLEDPWLSFPLVIEVQWSGINVYT